MSSSASSSSARFSFRLFFFLCPSSLSFRTTRSRPVSSLRWRFSAFFSFFARFLSSRSLSSMSSFSFSSRWLSNFSLSSSANFSRSSAAFRFFFASFSCFLRTLSASLRACSCLRCKASAFSRTSIASRAFFSDSNRTSSSSSRSQISLSLVSNGLAFDTHSCCTSSPATAPPERTCSGSASQANRLVAAPGGNGGGGGASSKAPPPRSGGGGGGNGCGNLRFRNAAVSPTGGGSQASPSKSSSFRCLVAMKIVRVRMASRICFSPCLLRNGTMICHPWPNDRTPFRFSGSHSPAATPGSGGRTAVPFLDSSRRQISGPALPFRSKSLAW
mmetsp:Transcript_48659/g.129026  ORF Transcript_48659/g.129026 Transcript_48659/m.129026 type:complete len:330 (-) Transcript_48659:158-1147(-)